jgi:histone H1/5
MPRGSAGTGTKSKKDKSAPAHPKYEEMIREAILSLKERKGSSRQAIKKYILNTFKLPDNTTTASRIRIAIQRGVEKGVFAFPNGPSGTIKLARKESPPKVTEKKEKKESKPKKEKKEAKPKSEKKTPKKTAKKTTTKKTTTKRAAPKKAKAAAPKKTTKRTARKSAAKDES